MFVSNCLPIEKATKSDNNAYCNFGLECSKPISAATIKLEPNINGMVKRSAEKCNCASIPTSQKDMPASSHAKMPRTNMLFTQPRSGDTDLPKKNKYTAMASVEIKTSAPANKLTRVPSLAMLVSSNGKIHAWGIVSQKANKTLFAIDQIPSNGLSRTSCRAT